MPKLKIIAGIILIVIGIALFFISAAAIVTGIILIILGIVLIIFRKDENVIEEREDLNKRKDK